MPRDVSVVGFDDSQLIAFTDPPLTTVRQPVQAMATAAVGALLEEICGKPRTAARSSSSSRNSWCAGSTAQAPAATGGSRPRRE